MPIDDLGLVEALQPFGIDAVDLDMLRRGDKLDKAGAKFSAAIERLLAEVQAADLRTGAASKVALEMTAERDEARKAAKEAGRVAQTMTHQFQYEAGKHSDWLERCMTAEAQRDKLKEALDRLSSDATQIMSKHDPRGAETAMSGDEANKRVHQFVADAATFIESIPSRARQALQDSKT